MLGGCLAVLLLCGVGFAGCVGCAAIAYNMGEQATSGGSNSYNYDYSYGSNGSNGSNGSTSSDSSTVYTIDELKTAMEDAANKVEDGRCTPGVYEVGAGKDISAGQYFFEGSQSEESYYYVLTNNGNDTYSVSKSVVYFGNYMANLQDGELVVFDAEASLRMYTIDKATFAPTAPYQSGLYRVGTDLPAGTYTITIEDSAAAGASQDCAAFIMKDLEFNEDSITESKYVARGGKQTITVKDGDYLELYATTATAE